MNKRGGQTSFEGENLHHQGFGAHIPPLQLHKLSFSTPVCSSSLIFFNNLALKKSCILVILMFIYTNYFTKYSEFYI